jgi:hypothetical protein
MSHNIHVLQRLRCVRLRCVRLRFVHLRYVAKPRMSRLVCIIIPVGGRHSGGAGL